ncbi:MAG: hypothetical protein IJ239_06805 [Eubacterium sp.]|nr:hypothetical protein [Eubacterium sp.]
MKYRLKTVLLTLVLSCALLNGCGQSSSDAALNTEPSAGSAVSERETETASSASERETDAASSASEPETEAETLYASSQPVADSPEWVTKLDAAKDAEQLIVVAGVDKTTAYVTMHEKDAEGTWKQLIATPGFIGLDGLGDANINDCYTPVGTFTIDKAFGIADDPGCQMEYTKVDDTYYWSGDPRDGMHFNELVSIKDLPDLDTENSEHITDFDYAYQYVLNMGYNSECEYEKGFAFFQHCFRRNRTYTGGCVGVP